MLISINYDEAKEIVTNDVTDVMREILSPSGDEPFRLGGPFSPNPPDGFEALDEAPVSDPSGRVLVFSWEWNGVDDGPGLADLGRTGEPVTLRGVTIVTRDDQKTEGDGWLLYRFIDWMDAFGQAGISVATRPVRDTMAIFGDEQLADNPELAAAYEFVAQRDGDSA
jgi:hypothetical protein